MITLGDYLVVSAILFAIGLAGVMLRRNLIVILMSLELMLNAANLSLVAFSRFRIGGTGLPEYNAEVLVFFVITVAAERDGVDANLVPGCREGDVHSARTEDLVVGMRRYRQHAHVSPP